MSDTALSSPPANRDREEIPSSGPSSLELLGHEYRAELLRRGYEVIAKLDPRDTPPLERWLGKEEALVAAVWKHAKGGATVISDKEYDHAVHAFRVGRVLAEAEHAPALRVPEAFGDQRKDIERLATRLFGFGLAKGITAENLRNVSSSQMRSLLDNARKLGLLDEGQGWATKLVVAKCMSHDLGQAVERNKALDRGIVR